MRSLSSRIDRDGAARGTEHGKITKVSYILRVPHRTLLKAELQKSCMLGTYCDHGEYIDSERTSKMNTIGVSMLQLYKDKRES